MTTNRLPRPTRSIRLRIGLPEERGPRTLGAIRAPGAAPVAVVEPEMGSSGTRARIVALPYVTADGMRWEVRWQGPNMTGEAVTICRTIRDARAEAKRLRTKGP